MEMIRKIFAPLGYLLGPPLALAYYVLLRLVNGSGGEKRTYHPKQSNVPVEFYLVPNSKLVKGAVTLGKRIFTQYRLPSTKLLLHEVHHRVQIENLGKWKFYAWWGYQFVRWGYKKMPIEVEAREVAGQI